MDTEPGEAEPQGSPMTRSERPAALLWALQAIGYCAFALGVAPVALLTRMSSAWDSIPLAGALVSIEGEALRTGTVAVLFGVGREGEDGVAFRPLRALVAAGAFKLAGGLMDGEDGWLPAILFSFGWGGPSRQLPASFGWSLVTSQIVPLVTGLAFMALALALVIRSESLRSGSSKAAAFVLARPWLAHLIVAVWIQTLTGFWGIDSYGIGFPFPFYDSSTMGAGLKGPIRFSVAAFASSLFFLWIVLGVVARLLRSVREGRKAQA
ncbi:MAG TPA: hypothetical protein VJ725_29480 [Thermoanaerobaculia bacterium]|nr:hypothetical protein [Thermoanaerobaculia bacterium]